MAMTSVADLPDLAASLAGSVVLPEDPEFPNLRRMFHSRPGEEVVPQAVIRCAGLDDVVAGLGFARAQRLPFAVRSGGHSFADLCTTDGLLIDLGQMSSVEFDGATVTAGPGIRLGRLAEKLAEHRRMVQCGWNPLVAVAGAVLGGGYGAFCRRYGLGCDQLQAAQVVLADGRVVWADEQREPELFWALRGAGWGSFGVVTALVLRTLPVPRVATFVHHWPWREVTRVIDAWQRWAPEAPDEINAELVLQRTDPAEEPRVTLFGTVIGSAAEARPALAEFLDRLGGDELEELTELSPRVAPCRHTYAGAPVMSTLPPALPPDYRPYLRVVRSEFFAQPMPLEAIEALVSTFAADPPPGQYQELELIPWGGAIGRVPPESTAFVNRTPRFMIGHHGFLTGRAGAQEQAAVHGWVSRSWHAVHRWAAGAVYPNYPDLDLEPDAWAEAYHGANLPRLREVKARYDPEDVFRFPHSVPLPAGSSDRRADP